MLDNHNHHSHYVARTQHSCLDLFLMEMGIIDKKTDIEDLEDVLDPRYICLQKGYYRTPYNENGEIAF